MAEHQMFIGTYSKGDGKGLIRGVFDDYSGGFSVLDNVDVENPSYLCLSGDKRYIYGVSETDSYIDETGQHYGGQLFSVLLFDINKMQLTSIEGTHGKSPCHLCIQDGYIFAANYTEGSLTVFNVNNDGSVGPSEYGIHHYGSGPNRDRQEKPHIHYCYMTPDKKYLAICDLGLDSVFLYPYSKTSGLSLKPKKIACPEGSGPRHLVFSQNGEYLYVLTELHNTVLVYKYCDGEITPVQEYSTLPDTYSGDSSAAAIHISPDKNLLAVSNRGHNSITVFRMESDGRLSERDFIKTGAVPRDFSFSSDGEWILCAEQEDNTVTSYKYNSRDRKYHEVDKVSIPHPVCIIMLT